MFNHFYIGMISFICLMPQLILCIYGTFNCLHRAFDTIMCIAFSVKFKLFIFLSKHMIRSLYIFCHFINVGGIVFFFFPKISKKQNFVIGFYKYRFTEYLLIQFQHQLMLHQDLVDILHSRERYLYLLFTTSDNPTFLLYINSLFLCICCIVSLYFNSLPMLYCFYQVVAIATTALEGFKNDAKTMVTALVDMERVFVPPQHFIRLVQRRYAQYLDTWC